MMRESNNVGGRKLTARAPRRACLLVLARVPAAREKQVPLHLHVLYFSNRGKLLYDKVDHAW